MGRKAAGPALNGGDPSASERSGQSAAPKNTLPRELAQQIRRGLAEGSLRPGERLSPTAMAQQLNVSHIPVREALKELHAQGLVSMIRNRGFFVPDLSLADVEDIYLWRSVLEDRAQRMAVPVLSNDVVHQLEAICARMEEASRRKDVETFHRENRVFHFLPFRQVCTDRFFRMLDALWDSADNYQSVLIRVGPSVSQLQHQHQELLEAYQHRDVEAAIRIMAEHRNVTLTLMRQKLQGQDAVRS